MPSAPSKTDMHSPAAPCERLKPSDSIRRWNAACTRMSLAEVGRMEYQIQANTRRCAVSGRELHAGEKFYSVLTEEHGKLARLDYAADAWQGPPHGTFSFWSGR